MISPLAGLRGRAGHLGVLRRRLATGGSAASGFSALVLSRNPQAAWALGEVAGNAIDYSPNARNLPRRTGTTVGGNPSFVNGLSAAVEVDGSNTGYGLLNVSDFTWGAPYASQEVWMRGNTGSPTSVTAWAGGSMSLTISMDTAPGFGSTQVSAAIKDAALVTTTRTVTLTGQPWVTKTVANNSPIYHCVMVYDGLNFYLYMNGVEVAKSPDYPGTLGSSGSAFGVARSTTLGRPVRMQGAAFYPFAMTPAQVSENYAAGIAA